VGRIDIENTYFLRQIDCLVYELYGFTRPVQTGQRVKMTETGWSKREKEIARRVFEAAYRRECMAALEVVRKMAAEIDDPTDLWRLSEYLVKMRKEVDEKYDYRYSVLPIVFARLIHEEWIKPEDLAGLSEEKLEKIRQIAEFWTRS